MLKSIMGVLSTLQITIFTLFRGKIRGTDSFGNTYYTGKARPGSNKERRWVIYDGEAEASAVPPEFHGWLHYQTDIFPDKKNGTYRQKWQKPHSPNLTGTSAAYVPKGHKAGTADRAKATGDYEAWTPQK